MKKMMMFACLLCCVFLFGACSSNSFRSTFFSRDDKGIIRSYFEAFIDGVNNHDEQAIRSLFVSPQKSDDALTEQIEAAFSYLPTPLTITTSADGCSSSGYFSHGKRRTDVEAIFAVECNDQLFYASMKICSEDSTNSEEVGIISVYFINSQDCHEDVRYWGDGKWTPGINLSK